MLLGLALLATLTLSLSTTPEAAFAAPPRPDVVGATVHSHTGVRVIFDTRVDASAENPANYTVTPGLVVLQAQRTDDDYGVLLTTGAQLNGMAYTVSVDGVRSAGGQMMNGPQTARFTGTLMGPDAMTAGHDDFNRPSGLTASDTPAGPWATTHVDAGNAMALVESPALFSGGGQRALRSYVSNTDAEADNAAVLHTAMGHEFYASAYVMVPTGQGWEPGHAAGLLRLNQWEYTGHARLSAFLETPDTFTLKVNFKSTGNAYVGEQVVATGLPYGRWHWYQLHVRNSPVDGQPGMVRVWIDGRLRYAQHSLPVARRDINFVEFGVMHNVAASDAPPSTTYTDAARMGVAYQLPSIVEDHTPPTGQLTAPSPGAVVRGTVDLQASTDDDAQVVRVDYRVDGAPVGSADLPPFRLELDADTLAEGPHTLDASLMDTSGNVGAAPPVLMVVDRTQATVTGVAVDPSAFTPGDDAQDERATLTYTTMEPTWQRVTVRDHTGGIVATPRAWSEHPAGVHTVAWDGRRGDGALAADGDYVLRVEVKDLVEPALPPAVGEATVRLLGSLGDVRVTPSPFSANGDGVRDTTDVSYVLRATATTAVTVRDAGGAVVRTLRAPAPQSEGSHVLAWDGRGDDGAVRADGVYRVRVAASTTAGTSTRERAVTLDTTPPTTRDDADGGWHETPATVTLTAEDGLSEVAWTRSRVDGGEWRTGTAVQVPAPSDGSNDGVHTVEYQSADVAGNVEAPRDTAVRIDAGAPVTSHDGDDAWHQMPYELQLTPADAGAGVHTTYWRLGSNPWNTGRTVSFARRKGSPDGYREVTYYSIDALGHAEAPRSVTVRIDSQAPATAWLADPPLPSGDVIVRLFPWDRFSGVAATWYSVDEGPWLQGTEALVPHGAGDTRHRVRFYSVDAAGNVGRWMSAAPTAEPPVE